MVIEDSLVIPSHKLTGITSTESPKVTDSTCDPKFQPLQFFAFHNTDVIPLQPTNAVFLIVVTLLGISIEVSPEQLEKA